MHARKPLTRSLALGGLIAVLLPVLATFVFAQQPPRAAPQVDPRIYDIVAAVSADRIEADIRTLAGFGTRNTFSDTLSDTRGIGAARRWIKAQFDEISRASGGKLEVYYDHMMLTQEQSSRIPHDVEIVSVVAIQRGRTRPNDYVLMAGDIDSRASGNYDFTTDAPGANDNASGMAGTIEAARVLTQYDFEASIVYLGLSAEEQGLYGGRSVATKAAEKGWNIIGVLNNDMIGNIAGDNGVIDNSTFRIFSEPNPATDELRDFQGRRTRGGEVDGPSRQLARYVARIADLYVSTLDPVMIYRLDRFGRGGHHRPFNDLGFPGVRIMETNESYIRQHQDIRMVDGIHYGDTIEYVDFEYASRITAVNAAALAALAWAPPAPSGVSIGGSNSPAAVLSFNPVDDPRVAGYKVYWRDTTAPQWEHFHFVADVAKYTTTNRRGETVIQVSVPGKNIDNYLFGVATVGVGGNESVVAFQDAGRGQGGR